MVMTMRRIRGPMMMGAFIVAMVCTVTGQTSKPPEKFPAAAGANVARLLSTPYDKETSLGDLRPGTRPNTFVTAEGVVLNGNYITLLRTVLKPAQTRLRTKGKTDPVV